MALENIVEDIVGYVQAKFKEYYGDGVSAMFTDRFAYLSFVCMMIAIDGLAGFFAPQIKKNGERFCAFVRAYFPDPLRGRAEDVWALRNSLVHAFNPGQLFALSHNKSPLHLVQTSARTGLNAEEFHRTLMCAADSFFLAAKADAKLQANFKSRAADPKGGVLVVAPVGE
jgi:hypothetical protein